jgi:DNA-binding CsgD family transcriptional regulator
MSTAQVWGGLPPFIDLLGRSPTPAAALRGLIDGPGVPLGVQSGALLRAHGPQLEVLARRGRGSRALAPVSAVHRSDDCLVCQAVSHGEVIAADPTVVAAPIISRGRAVGGLALARPHGRALTTVDIALLEGVGAALGLWLTHPDSGVGAVGPADTPPTLTPRQQAILTMIAAGRTNAAIAAALGYSPSTIKQEVHRLVRALDATDRRSVVERAYRLGLLPGRSS